MSQETKSHETDWRWDISSAFFSVSGDLVLILYKVYGEVQAAEAQRLWSSVRLRSVASEIIL